MALRDAFIRRKKNADGDYSPDPNSQRFPEWNPPNGTASASNRGSRRAAGKASLKQILEDWWTESKAAGLKPATYTSYKGTINALVAFLKHDDASRVTPEDVLRFKDHRLASGISARTVNDNNLSALKVLFNWAVTNLRMKSNPAKGISVKPGKPVRKRSKGFTEEEAAAILRAATSLPRGREMPRTWAAKRWVPWLCSYSACERTFVRCLIYRPLRKVPIA